MSGTDWLANIVSREYTFTNTELTPLQVSGAIGYVTENNFASPPLNAIIAEAIIVSSPQLDTADTVTVYLAFPVEQLTILLNTPTLIPGAAVDVLNCGVVVVAQDVDPPPPPPPALRCPTNVIDNNAIHTNTNAGLIKQFFILPPDL